MSVGTHRKRGDSNLISRVGVLNDNTCSLTKVVQWWWQFLPLAVDNVDDIVSPPTPSSFSGRLPLFPPFAPTGYKTHHPTHPVLTERIRLEARKQQILTKHCRSGLSGRVLFVLRGNESFNTCISALLD